MATIDVLDADGVEQTIERPLSPGRAAAAASRPVVVSTEDAAILGSLTETAPATDTASSGLNGRLQRVAQRVSSLISLLPTALGSSAAASSLAVTASTEDVARVGIVTETAPATDTASSGLNGRLQRIAQRLTALIAQVPATLGQKSQALSLSVTLSQEDRTKLDDIFTVLSKASGSVPFSVAAATSSTAILASSGNRRGAAFTNDSSVVCYILLNSGTASTTNFTVKMPPGGYYEVPFGYTGAITAIWPSATGSLRGAEFT